jgi:type I restriction enzyme M protein
VILANPPFMTPKGGIRPHKRWSVQANRSEVLFVDYIMEHISTNGRGGVIVPEGIIFQSANAYKALRKLLVDTHLFAVVSLPSGVFQPYAGVKTSILLMDRTLAKRAPDILFVKIESDGFDPGAQRRPNSKSDLPAALSALLKFRRSLHEGKECEFSEDEKRLAHRVLRAKIAEGGDYNLSGERYKETAHRLKSDYPMIEFDKVCSLEYGASLPEKDRIAGEFPVVGSNGITGWHNKFLIEGPAIIVGRKGSAGEVVYIDKPCFPIDTTYYVKINKNVEINFKYLYFVIKELNLTELKGGGAVPGLNRNDVYATRKIPLPPLSVQQEIVAEIEGYQKVVDGARQVVENYKPSIKIDTEWEVIELKDFCEFFTGGTPKSTIKEYYGGNIKWLVSGDIHKGEIFDCEGRITESGLSDSNAKYLPINSVLIALNGQGKTRGTVALLRTKATCNQSIVSINPKKENLISEYLFFILKSKYQQIRGLTGDNQRSGLNIPIIKTIKIPLPTLDVQKKIVAQIEEEQKLVKANRRLIEVFEAKIKSKIAEVWGQI